MATPKQPVFSNTILQGADYIVSLIQQEKAKAIALTRQELAAEITRRDQAAELAAKESESKLIAALSDASKARADVENLHIELARANAEIAKLQPIITIFEKLGFTFGADNTIKANGGLAVVFAGGELGKDGMTVDPSQVLGNLLRTLDGRRAGMLFWGEMYQGLTKEQIQLKENFEAKIAGYVAQIESLQAELKSLKSVSSHVVPEPHDFPTEQSSNTINLAGSTGSVEPTQSHTLQGPEGITPDPTPLPSFVIDPSSPGILYLPADQAHPISILRRQATHPK